jgi:hypothetical protein
LGLSERQFSRPGNRGTNRRGCLPLVNRLVFLSTPLYMGAVVRGSRNISLDGPYSPGSRALATGSPPPRPVPLSASERQGGWSERWGLPVDRCQAGEIFFLEPTAPFRTTATGRSHRPSVPDFSEPIEPKGGILCQTLSIVRASQRHHCPVGRTRARAPVSGAILCGMKRLDQVFAWTLFVLGIIHCALTPLDTGT